jgi:hypothetical protein
MANTTNFNWETPDDTDLVKDGAAAIRTLGSAIDTSLVDLKGGTTGQVLSKATNTDMDFTWVAQDDSNAIQNALLTTTGDTIYASGASTPARLGIGTSGQVLTVSGGVPAWTTVSSGGMTLISTTTLSGASVLLDSIPSTYNHLQLVVQNYKPATDGQNLFLRFNGDSTANRYNDTNGSAETSDFDDTKVVITPLNDNSVATGLAWVNIPNYANTTTWKFLNSLALMVNETTTANYRWANFYGFYNQTAAISSITLAPTSGNFTSGTVLLYGVK